MPRNQDGMSEVEAAGFAAGEAGAVRAVYREFSGPMFGAAYRLLGDRSLAEEAVQQAFLQAWRAAGSYDPLRPIAPWLFAIVRRVAIDLHRRERRHVTEELEVEPVVESKADQAWAVLEVRRAIQQLPDDEREVLAATHFDGLTHEEAAVKLGVPVGTVKSRSHRAYRRLRALVGDMNGGQSV